jgi:hypothetical protein
VSRERCQGDMGDSNYTERAFRAYFRAGANIQPSASSSGLRSHEGRDYVVLENCNGILAEQEIRIGEMERRGEDTRIAQMACSRSEVCLGSLIEGAFSRSRSTPH